MKKTIALGMAALAVTGTAGIASAKSKPKPPPPPVCNLVTDPTGDAGASDTFHRPAPVDPTRDPALDLTGADLASDAKTVTAVIKLAGKPSFPDPNMPDGAQYYMGFTPMGGSSGAYLGVSVDPQGAFAYEAGAVTTDSNGITNYTPSAGANVRGKLDGTTFTVTADIKSISDLAKLTPGTVLTSLKAETFNELNAVATGVLLYGDSATGAAKYTAGAPSCVKPV